jgi:hypothetical protein
MSDAKEAVYIQWERKESKGEDGTVPDGNFRQL